jgi:cysteine desulfurase / selenocysteine lyase
VQTPNTTNFPVETLRKDFPILINTQIKKHPLIYLDNAATTQKPRIVIETIQHFYKQQNANIHRGIHTLSQQTTQAYENARQTIANFINSPHPRQIIFVRGATEAINLVAQTFVPYYLRKGDEIILSALEHHANIVPWQLICQKIGAKIRVIPMDKNGSLDLDTFNQLLQGRPKLLAITHISNTLGTINPIKTIIQTAHRAGVPVLIDAAQSVPHIPIDVQDLDCDFLVFSGHKLFAPTGIGILYGKEKWLHAMPPWQGGGGMIQTVSFEKTTYRQIPYKFEPGTPNISGALGLAKAIDYLGKCGLTEIQDYEHSLFAYTTQKLSQIKNLRIIGTSPQKTAIISFIIKGIHPHDIATFLDNEGIAIRAGHHCTQPIMQYFGIPATIRISLSFYNTRKEIDQLATSLQKALTLFSDE